MRKILTLSFLVLLLAGCSNDSVFQGMADDSTRDAKIEDATIAIDKKEYNEAITTLTEIYNTNYPDPEVSRLLGSAYMGKAGIDLTGFIEYEADSKDDIFDIVRSSLVVNPSPWIPNNPDTAALTCNVEDLTVLMTSSGGHFIDGHCINEIIDFLDKAKRVFYVLQIKDKDTPSDRIQYGILSAIHFAMLIGENTADALGSTDGTPAPVNKRAYYLYRNASVWSLNYRAKWDIINSSDHNFFSTPLGYYQEDLLIMNDALSAYDELGAEDYIKDDIESLLRNILQDPSGDIEAGIATMTTAGITGYINNVLSVE